MSTVSLNKKVPSFLAQSTGDQVFRLSACRGQLLVIYFYPKDNTPGCTRQGQDFSETYTKFKRNHAIVVGVSRDSLRSHEKFKDKHRLPFELLSDPDQVLCELFDVVREKNLYGRKVKGIERSTFLIDATGKLRRQWRRVKVDGHAQEVLEAIRDLDRG